MAPRLGAKRLAHVEAVAETIGRVAASWSAERREDAARAAWYHDACKDDPLGEMLAAIRAAGEEPDPWALRYAPVLVHAQAAAVWARSEMGERDAEVLLAVRHHPTGHPAWKEVGRALFVADFCEPRRPFARSLETPRIVDRAAAGPDGLAAAAVEVLALRLGRAIRSRRPIHSDGWRTWNAWTGAGEET